MLLTNQVSSTFRVPVNAILVVCGFVILLSLISLGSTVAFQAIISLQLVALFATYEVSICTLIWRRLSGLPLPHAKWSLGRYGLSINIFAAVYGLFAIAFIVLPPVPGVDPQTVNWGPFIFILVMIVAGLCFVIGAKAYHGPTITGA